MEITSYYFILSSVASIFVFYKLKPGYRMSFLALLSCVFVMTYSYPLLLYVLAFALFNYYTGIKIQTTGNNLFFKAGMVINLLQLFILKYASFTFDPVFRIFNADPGLSKLSGFIIPVGISYFTLQGIGYLINVHLKWEKPESNFIHFLLYIIFWPRFLSGPIERSNHFLPQLKKPAVFDEKNVTEGLRTILLGLFKKIAIANQLAPFVGNTYGNISAADSSSLWLLLLIQPLYLYFDFSGYTDIALGIARTFGIGLLPNFNRPFLSENMTGFWKRFHISLSSWFHDYVFIRTSFRFRRWGVHGSVFAIFITWMLFGVWHGAGWTFMILGLLQAIAIIYEFFTKRWRALLFSKLPLGLGRWIGRICTYFFFCGALVFFFAPDLNSVFRFYEGLSSLNKFAPSGINYDILIVVLFFMSVFLAFEIIYSDFSKLSEKLKVFRSDGRSYRVIRWTFYFFLVTILTVLNNETQEFVYFRF